MEEKLLLYAFSGILLDNVGFDSSFSDMKALLKQCRLVCRGISIRIDGMLRFTLFRVPVTIHPSLWLTLSLFAMGLALVGVGSIVSVLVFIVAGVLSLLAHELGHALVGRALAGGNPQIYMAWLGGECCNPEAKFTRRQGIIMTLAGPFANIILGLLAFFSLSLALGGMSDAWQISTGYICGVFPEYDVPFFSMGGLCFLRAMILISTWWTAFNLLPIYPLDGGQVLSGLMDSLGSVCKISAVVAFMMFFLFLFLNWWLIMCFMGALALLNFHFARVISATPSSK